MPKEILAKLLRFSSFFFHFSFVNETDQRHGAEILLAVLIFIVFQLIDYGR